MAETPDTLFRMTPDQALASSPHENVWLSASAGSGKTSVLASRVKRLLLQGVRADAILCLTFTRAGAAEMARRIGRDLASWAMMPELALKKELFLLDEDDGPESIAMARRLFAQLLESRGGGLRVMTIHAFCQTLLGTFPLEAGLAPGFRAIEGREQAALASQVLGRLAEAAEREGDAPLIAALRALSRRLGEAKAQSFLLKSAKSVEALEALPEGIAPHVRRMLGVPADFDEEYVPARCADSMVDRASLLELARMHVDWGTKTGEASADAVSNWLLGSEWQRASELSALSSVWLTQKNEFRSVGPKDPGYRALVERLNTWCSDLQQTAARAALADDIAHALLAARRYARAYADAKRAAGFVDFDDLIALAVSLLREPGMGAWVSYKLDTATDHILVDEAQDTNERQWEIVDALTSDFWAGQGAKGDRPRTLFTVGDYKQAIFGFQGTDPRFYAAAGDQFETAVAAAGRRMERLSLDRSFRSSPPVLDVVDALIAERGEDAFGDQAADRHQSAKGGPGRVILLPPVRAAEDDAEASDEGEEGWVATPTRELAGRIAEQVRDWIREGHRIESRDRAIRPGDVMILVRKRGDLAALLVARLQAAGVPVAGVDRLRLAAPLAVQDCLAAIRFALQPGDDLTLASLLVSPICGWTQQQLFDVAHPARSGSLWNEIRNRPDTGVLRTLLSMEGFETPYGFLESMLSGEIGARRKLLLRLGNEAADAIDELLNAAMQFEREGIATLQGFADWFDRGEGEVVRDLAGGGDAVRVMTVHAAKGLEAPLVILADATGNPEVAQERDFKWVLDETIVPLFTPRKAERDLDEGLTRIAALLSEQDRREHWRLLYVAMTRAEEQLVIAGSLTQRQKTVPEESWHAAIERAMTDMEAPEVELPGWGSARIHATVGDSKAVTAKREAATVPVERPGWLDRAAPPEARPPRPLSPSSLGADTVADPPPSATMQAAAERGRLIHALFERLPQLPAASRRDAADRWLATSAGVADAGVRGELTGAVVNIIESSDYAHFFDTDGLSEVPIAGVVNGIVISGTVDRLVFGSNTVDIVDFKTGRRVPSGVDAVPDAYKRQMAAYAAVLRGVFPGHDVRAALLYTAGPKLTALGDVDLELHKPGFAVEQQELLSPAG